VSLVYPASTGERDRWILARRGERVAVDPFVPYAFLVEEERFASGEVGAVATVFLTNRECPFRCAMCDLWKHTLTETVPVGAIAGQVSYALGRLEGSGLDTARQVKLYNSGSFFDARAIPVEDYGAIAAQVRRFERVIVESHPAFVGDDCWRFAAMIGTQLEVAMGLETAHPATLERLNKRMTLEQYARAAGELSEHGVALRAFVLVQPPFLPVEEALEWACKSIDFAFGCGATAVSLLPTRAGNGAVDTLAAMAEFVAPSLDTVEDALDYGIGLCTSSGTGRVFVDLWEMERVAACVDCRKARVERMRRMNLKQVVLERVRCGSCG
jgi:radical SAM enzyme (TIGR01210 family)